MFSPRGVLAGVHWGRADYRHVNSSGNLFGNTFDLPYELPVWQYRSWILDIVNGASSSAPPDDGPDEPPGRRLEETAGGGLPMTLPPQPDVCDDGARCASPDPTWKLANLVQGTVPATCADVSERDCTFGSVTFAREVPGRLDTGDSGVREVMVWCRADPPRQPGAVNDPVLRVSFTNAERREVPVGQGWWDVPPQYLVVDGGKVNPLVFAPC